MHTGVVKSGRRPTRQRRRMRATRRAVVQLLLESGRSPRPDR
ncbi:hypothetical protein I552_0026 [Mycobacterium xenopi 3993]|nr:hypothetical protein I552_0026 [Mycobacterium xenopi 3993]